jgi:hypothetical protein
MPDQTPNPWDDPEDNTRQIAGREVFDEWLAAMDPKLTGFEDLYLPDGFPFDYSRESLDDLEKIILGTLANDEDVYDPAHVEFVDRCVRYIGEALIKNFGGEWRYDTDPNVIGAGIPSVVNDDGTEVPVVPLHAITSLTSRRTGAELVHIYDGTERYYRDYQAKKPAEERRRPDQEAGPKLNDLERKFLNQWQSTMEGVLSSWNARFIDGSFPLNFTRESLSGLEQVLLSRFHEHNQLEDPDNLDFTDGAVRYFGETLVRNGIAHWDYHDSGDQPADDNPYYRTPYIQTNVPGEGYSSVPLLALMRAVRDRTGDFLQKVYDLANTDMERHSAGG